MSQEPAAVRLLRSLAAVLRRRRLKWYVFGAQAVVLYGRPRMTADVDVTVAIGRLTYERLVADLGKAGFRPRVPAHAALTAETRVLPLVHGPTAMPLDLVFAGPGLEEDFLARARTRDVGGLRVPVISAEDLVAVKVLAGRPKDIDDALGVLVEQADRLDLGRARLVLRSLDEALGRNDLVQRLEELAREAERLRDPT